MKYSMYRKFCKKLFILSNVIGNVNMLPRYDVIVQKRVYLKKNKSFYSLEIKCPFS